MAGEQIIYDLQVRANVGAAAAGADDLKKRYDAVGASAQSAAGKTGGLFGAVKNQFSALASDLKTDPFAAIGKGFIGGQIASAIGGAFEFIRSKAKLADDAADQLDIALSKAGLTGAAKAEEFNRLGDSAAKIAEDFALSKFEVQKLQATVVGFSGAVGGQVDKLTEISLGAAGALGLSAEGVARLIAKGADPDAQAQLSRLGIVFDKNADAAGRMAAIEAKLGGAIQATKDSTQDAFGTFDRLTNKLGDAIIVGSAAVFEGIGTAVSFISDNFEELTLALLPPVGVVVQLIKHFDDLVAIGQDVGNFLGLISDVDAANQDAARSVSNAADLFAEFGDKVKAADAAIASAKGQTDAVKRFEELSAQTKLNADDQAELAKLNSQLADTYGEAVSGVNALTGEYDINLKKAKELSDAETAAAGADKRKLIEENLIGPTKDLLPALDAQKAKLAELREELDNAIQSGDKDDILEAKSAYDEQTQAIKGTEEQLKKNVKALIEQKQIGTGSAEEIAKALGVSRSEAEKLVPKVQQVNRELEEQKRRADAVAESAAGMAESFDKAAQAANNQFKEQLGALKGLDLQLRDAIKRKDKDAIASLRQRIKDEEQLAREADRRNDEINAVSEKRDAQFADKKQKEAKSRLEVELARIERESKDRLSAITENEADFTTGAIDAVRKGTREQIALNERESATLTRSRLDDLKKQRDEILNKIVKTDAAGNIVGLSVGVKKGEEAKIISDMKEKIAALDLSIAKEEGNLIGLQPRFSQAAVDKSLIDLQAAVGASKLKEIEVGIRPQEDALPVLQQNIDRIAAELDKKRKELSEKEFDLNFSIGDTNKLKTEVEGLFQQLLGAQQEFGAKKKSLDAELRDAIIGNIAEEEIRERAALEARQADELAVFDKSLAANGELTEREEKLKTEILKRHERERADLRKKSAKDVFDVEANLQKIGDSAAQALMQAAFEDTKKLSNAELALKRKQFGDEDAALRKKLAQGQISQEEFTASINKLAESRSAFEQEQAEASRSAIERSLKATGEAAIKAAEAWAVQAVMTIVAGAVSGLGPVGVVLAPIIGAAAGVAVKGILSNVKSLFGFAEGGVMVGEGGGIQNAEIISPATDYAQFATMLVFSTVRAVERKLEEDGVGRSGIRGRSDRLQVSFDRIPLRGRDIDYQARANEIATRTERIA